MQTFNLFMLKTHLVCSRSVNALSSVATTDSLMSQLACYTTVSAQSNTPLDALMLKNAEGLGILYHRISSLWDERSPRKTGFSMVCNGKNLASISYKSIKGDSTKLCCSNYSQSRQWHPTPVLLPGKSCGRRSLEGCSPWSR